MNRREFISRVFGGLGIIGLAHLNNGCSYRSLPITILSIPDFISDYHKDFARVFIDDGLVMKNRVVLLKPNFVEYHHGRPIHTDIRLINQISEACLSLGAKEVIVAEAPGHRRDHWHSLINPVLKQNLDPRVRRIDLNYADTLQIRNKGSYSGLHHFYVSAPVSQADIVISMPKMKTHHWVGVTLSMKNLFGILPGIFYGWPKNPLHFMGIENSILDLMQTVPVHYAVVDGVVGMEGDGPIMGTAKKVGAVIMGRDLLAVDCTAARIMGFNPHKIPYLERAGKHFRGLHESSIVYRGEHPKRFATQFNCLPQFTKAQDSSIF